MSIFHEQPPDTLTRRRNRRGSVIELVPSFFLMFFALVFPMLDLIGFVSAVVILNSVASMSAHSAARATTYGEAADVAARVAEQTASICGFARITPVGGIHGKGVSLLVECHKIALRQSDQMEVTTVEPSKEVQIKIDRNNYLYFYRTTARFEVLPIFNFAGSPFGLGEVPGLGKPVLLQYTSSANIEHPEGLNVRDRK